MGAMVGAILDGVFVVVIGAMVGAVLDGAVVATTGATVGLVVTNAIVGFCVTATLGAIVDGTVVGESVNVSHDAGGLSDKSHIPRWIQPSKALTLV